MNPPEDQLDPSPAPKYVDPEEFDMSEQQFSASLETEGERPTFVVESDSLMASHGEETRGQPPFAAVDGSPDVGRMKSSAMPVECSSRTRHNSGQEKLAYPERTSDGCPQIQKASDESSELNSLGNAEPTSDWREQVSAKVNSYKSRRPRKERFPSLQLQFDPAHSPSQRLPEVGTFLRQTPEEPIVPAPRQAAHDLPILLEATARIIEFPRPVSPPIRTDELAEPVIDRPRILDVPELLPAPPAMGGILIEQRPEPQPERRPGLEIPLQTADLQRRLWAAAVDGVIVLTAAAAFAYIFLRFTSVLPPWRIDLELIGGVIAVLWSAYQYSLLVYCGTTPGLRFAKLSIQRFDGSPVPRKLRRWRVLASFLSAISLGLGYAWCFLDEDQLTWHDRITRTHLAFGQATEGNLSRTAAHL